MCTIDGSSRRSSSISSVALIPWMPRSMTHTSTVPSRTTWIACAASVSWVARTPAARSASVVASPTGGSSSMTSTVGDRMARVSATTTLSMSNGFGSTVKTPSEIASRTRPSTANAVMSTTGHAGRIARILRKRSTPFIPGMRTSENTRSNGWLRNSSSACSPFSAVVTSKPSSSRLPASVSRRERSSSTTRMRILSSLACRGGRLDGVGPVGRLVGQDDRERRPLADVALDGDRSAVRRDHVGHDGEPEARSLHLRRVERLEDVLADVGRHPVAVVDHLDAPLAARGPAVGAHAHAGPGGAHARLDGVLHQVGEDLPELVLVEARDRQLLGDLVHELDPLRSEERRVGKE